MRNKTVLITGGTGDLGKVVAERFFDLGAKVAVSYRSKAGLKKLPEKLERQIFPVPADVTDEIDVRRLFRAVVKKFHSLEILINLVGCFLSRKTLQQVTLPEWEQMHNINLKSTFLCSREYLRHAKNPKYGRIINVGAISALKPSAGRAPYSVAKAGVIILTQVLGEELKNTGITSNVLVPSILDTRANRESMPGEDFSKWVTCEQMAETMVFLCSNAAIAINGACIPMFGGFSN